MSALIKRDPGPVGPVGTTSPPACHQQPHPHPSLPGQPPTGPWRLLNPRSPPPTLPPGPGGPADLPAPSTAL
ncbi:hypothetical protein NHX12_001014 [Muraenolepis orangiensis]|uniref:Uncharacterized protein n=1 Tax=Muraenolepis orangiensis TaxID=630683 RepID=A0A9Q0IHR6_9TELE|nr:hypothetical protein NHX12_001014 [Muraenolepis orangiensis]